MTEFQIDLLKCRKFVKQSKCELWDIDNPDNRLNIVFDKKDFDDRVKYAKSLFDYEYVGEEELKGHILRKYTFDRLNMILEEIFLTPYKNNWTGKDTSESSFNKLYFYKASKLDFEPEYKVKKVYTSERYKRTLGVEYIERKEPVSKDKFYKFPVRMPFNLGWCQGTFYFKTEEEKIECYKLLLKKKKELGGYLDLTGCEKLYGGLFITPKVIYNPFYDYKKEQFYIQVNEFNKVVKVFYFIDTDLIEITRSSDSFNVNKERVDNI